MILNGFVLEPNRELVPDYKISPFSTSDLTFNKSLPDSDLCDDYFKERFRNLNYSYTLSGRHAINLALSHYNLNEGDCVTILTTSGNLYISSCVTKEIEKFCRWSREFEENTKVILVNHEFGYPFHDLIKLKERNLPIIEDCAHSFFSKDSQGSIGTVGDFIVYSFPKIFPIQAGGLLVSPHEKKSDLDIESVRYIRNVISHYIPFKDEIIRMRKDNYMILRDKLKMLGFSEHFAYEDGTVPGVFLFKVSDPDADLQGLKYYMYLHGIECSVFYGANSFYIPCHQRLTDGDFDYFTRVIDHYLKNKK